METFLGSHKLAWHFDFLPARLRVHAMRVGVRTRAHVCVRTFLDVFVPDLVETFLCMGYMICTYTLACAHYVRKKHAL
jgi:hypothetical protein